MPSPRTWRPALLVATAFVVVMLGTTLPTPLYPALGRTYHFGELTTTILFAVYPLGVTTTLLVVGGWSDQLGRRPVLAGGLVLAALSSAGFLLAHSMPELYAARLLSGFSAGVFTGTATATIVDLAPQGRRGQAGLVAAAATMGGLGLGSPIAGVLTEHAPSPLRLSFGLHLALLAVAAGCLLATPESVTRAERPRLRPQAVNVPPEVRPVFVGAATAGFAGFAVLGVFGAVSPAFLGTLLHETSQTVVGLVVFSVFGPSVVGQLATARLGTDRSLSVGCLTMAAGLVVLGASLPLRSLPVLVVGGVLAGLGQGLSFRAGLSAVTDASPDAVRGEVSSAYFVMLYVGIALPVVGVGVLSTTVGLVPAGLVFSGLMAALALLAWWLLSRRRATPPAG